MLKPKYLLVPLMAASITYSCESKSDEQQNPLLAAYKTPHEVPPFDLIKIIEYSYWCILRKIERHIEQKAVYIGIFQLEHGTKCIFFAMI